MVHSKKLVLVPHETLSRLHEKPVTRSGSDVIGELDIEMGKILSQKAEDSEKWKMYHQTLQRYLHFINEQRKPLEISFTSRNDGQKDFVRANDDDNARLMTQLKAVIPRKFKDNATALFESLTSQQAKPQIEWDALGSVSIQNTPLVQSNIIELISDATRNRTAAKAPGWKKFASVIRKLNVPLNLIANKEYKDFIRTQTGTGVIAHVSQKVNLTGKSQVKSSMRRNPYIFENVATRDPKQTSRTVARRKPLLKGWSTHWSLG